MNRELSTEDLLTKGCDDYHAQKDMEAEREAVKEYELPEYLEEIGEAYKEFTSAMDKYFG